LYASEVAVSVAITGQGDRRQRIAGRSERVIPLPTVVAGGVVTGFQSFESAHRFGGAGLLRFSLVYHPGGESRIRSRRKAGRFVNGLLYPGRPSIWQRFLTFATTSFGWMGGWRLTFEEDTFPPQDDGPLSPATSLLSAPRGVVAVVFPGEE
jgi:hypothetical protein